MLDRAFCDEDRKGNGCYVVDVIYQYQGDPMQINDHSAQNSHKGCYQYLLAVMFVPLTTLLEAVQQFIGKCEVFELAWRRPDIPRTR